MKALFSKPNLAAVLGRYLSLFSFAFLLFAAPARSQTSSGLDLTGASNSYANLGIINPTGNFSTGLTIECWVKWDAFNFWSRLVEMGNGQDNNNLLFSNEGNTAKLHFGMYKGAAGQTPISSNATLVTGRWYHVAVTQDGAGVTTLYIDGVADKTLTLSRPNDVSRTQCYIGRSNWASDGYLDGRIDEVRIWNVARTAAQVRDNMLRSVAANEAGLVAYYRCNEGSGTTLNNIATNGGAGNGTLAAGASYFASPAQLVGNSMALDGVDDYVAIGSPLTADGSYTKEALIYLESRTGVFQDIISSTGTSFWIDTDGKLKGTHANTGNVVDGAVFPERVWTHVALSYNASNQTLKLYRDGVEVASNNSANGYLDQDVYVGAFFNGTSMQSFFGGKVDEVRIWNTVRTGAEIAANMGKELNPAAETNLVAYYTFNQGLDGGDNTGMYIVPSQVGLSNATLMNMALTGSSSNFVAQQSSLVLLPVTLHAFTAQKQGTGALLQWTTASETDMTKFVVEHSTDGRTWKAVGTVSATGNSSTKQYYRFTHTGLSTGNNYYRVAMLENSGKLTYTPVRSLTVQAVKKLFTVYQNAIDNGTIQVQVASPTTMSLYTQDGRKLWSKAVGAGTQRLSVDAGTKGIHYLTAEGTTERIVIR